MDQFERQFEHLDVQTQTMDEAMSGVTTLTTPEVHTHTHTYNVQAVIYSPYCEMYTILYSVPDTVQSTYLQYM